MHFLFDMLSSRRLYRNVPTSSPTVLLSWCPSRHHLSANTNPSQPFTLPLPIRRHASLVHNRLSLHRLHKIISRLVISPLSPIQDDRPINHAPTHPSYLLLSAWGRSWVQVHESSKVRTSAGYADRLNEPCRARWPLVHNVQGNQFRLIPS